MMCIEKRRVVVIVLDSAGCGEMPDSADFGDKGVNTLKHVAQACNGLNMPLMQSLGLGNITDIKGVEPCASPQASFGKMAELSKAKDTMAGHWELMGCLTKEPFPIFPEGFSEEIMAEFLSINGLKGYLGNKPASGTVIINDLGEEHLKSGYPIVYTSGDSVFQIAAHESVISVEKLYEICERTRTMCDKFNIGRVIARPFIKEGDNFKRTSNRKDFPMSPPEKTVLDYLHENNIRVKGVGKIFDIFNGQGIAETVHTDSNSHGMAELVKDLESQRPGFIFVNLVDFDMLFGHRRDPEGYGRSLEEFDRDLYKVKELLGNNDVLMITADHGCDPLHSGTDHTREYVPLIVFQKDKTGKDLGTRKSFGDLGSAVLSLFDVRGNVVGNSFIQEN